MSEPRLIDVADDLEIYGTSATDVRFLYQEIFERGSYRDVSLPPKAFVVDAGANVGIFTLFAKRACPDATIIAFEPVPDLAAAVRANVALFGLDDVTVHEVALGKERAEGVSFRHYPLRPSGSSLLLEDQTELRQVSSAWLPPRLNARMYQGREIVVEVATLSSLLPVARRIDLLKVDVVGAEVALFGGVAEEQWPLIDQVVVDTQDIAGRIAGVRELLASRGMTTSLERNPADPAGAASFVVYGRRG